MNGAGAGESRSFLRGDGSNNSDDPVGRRTGTRATVDFDRLFEAVYPRLLGYCVRLTGDSDAAHDAAQEAFVRLVRNDVTGELPALRVWLYKVATHYIRDRHKVERNRDRLLAETPPVQGSLAPPDADLEKAETVAAVRQSLAKLSSRDRELLLMKHDGFSYKEIGDAVGVAASSVGTLLARAQRRFATAHGLEEPLP